MPVAYVLHFNMVEDEKTEIISDVKTEIISASSTSAENSTTVDKLEDFFSIKSKVGDGGMGVVYLAKDIRLNRYVAIKRLKPQFLVDAQIRKRFLHEAKAVASLNNASIVHIYFIGEDCEGPYFVMEYIEGAIADPERPNQPNPPQTLEQYIAINGVMNTDKAIDFMLKIGMSVAAAHASGVIHRDLKPTNILIDIANFPKIVDFGLARITHTDASVSSLTVKGDKFISLGYGAPEQEQDASLTDERADVYGLGGIAYYILTGKNPRFFREDDLPEKVRPVITKALATNRDQRWDSVEALNAAFIQCRSETGAERPTVRTTWRCKWCDTVNPLSTRYCGGCGWDGGTACPECGDPNHFGVMFCSSCGANCKEYERVSSALTEARTALVNAQFEDVLTNCSKPLNFDPVGPNGRRIVDELNQIKAEAKKRQNRKEELSEIISMEINAENYERAEKFISEYRQLSASPEAYEAELSEFIRLKQRRDLARVAKLFALNDWNFGVSLLSSIKTTEGTANDLELRRLQKLYKKHIRKRRTKRYFSILFLIIAYLLLLPVAAAYLPSGLVRVAWYPANLIAKFIQVDASVASLANSLGSKDYSSIFVATNNYVSPVNDSENNTFVNPVKLEKDFITNREEFQRGYNADIKAWKQEYINSINKLSEEFKNEANMDAWVVARNELNRFESNNETIEIINLDNDFSHRIVSIQKTYILKRDMMLCTAYKGYISNVNKKLETVEASIKELMHKSATAQSQGNELIAETLMQEAEAYYNVKSIVKKDKWYINGVAFLEEFDKKYPDMASFVYFSDNESINNVPVVNQKREMFEKKMAEFASLRKDKEQKISQDYINALNNLLTQRRDAGDFYGISVITKELERYTHNQVFIANTATQELTEITKQFITKEQENIREVDSKLISFVNQYVSELDKLMSTETRANNIHVAAAIAAERTRVHSLHEIIEVQERLKKK